MRQRDPVIPGWKRSQARAISSTNLASEGIPFVDIFQDVCGIPSVDIFQDVCGPSSKPPVSTDWLLK